MVGPLVYSGAPILGVLWTAPLFTLCATARWTIPTVFLYGRLPGFGLTELGHAMAARAAEYLVDSGADIARVISSPLLRAQLTAAPTAAAYDLSIQSDPRLIESDNVFEGLPVNTNRAMLVNPKYYKYYCNPLRPSWGEPYRDIASRMSAALSSALRARGGTRPWWCRIRIRS